MTACSNTWLIPTLRSPWLRISSPRRHGAGHRSYHGGQALPRKGGNILGMWNNAKLTVPAYGINSNQSNVMGANPVKTFDKKFSRQISKTVGDSIVFGVGSFGAGTRAIHRVPPHREGKALISEWMLQVDTSMGYCWMLHEKIWGKFFAWSMCENLWLLVANFPRCM